MQLPASIPTFPDIAIDYIRAWLAVFRRGGQVFGSDSDYICALDSRAKRAVAGRVQSKTGRLRQKMITFDYIAIYFSRSEEGRQSQRQVLQAGT
jgi:hypothetical protein